MGELELWSLETLGRAIAGAEARPNHASKPLQRRESLKKSLGEIIWSAVNAAKRGAGPRHRRHA